MSDLDIEFFIVNQGDGWWDCPDRLQAVVERDLTDEPVGGRRIPGVVARVEPRIVEWHAGSHRDDPQGGVFESRLPMVATDRVIVQLRFPITRRAWSVPVIPLRQDTPAAGRVSREHLFLIAGAKVCIQPVTRSG